MPVKIDPEIIAELQAMDLVLWDAKHPKEAFFNPKTQKQSSREDKTWVIVSLAGPGVEGCYGSGATLRIAVDTALRQDSVSARVPGLKGALIRCEQAMFKLWGRMQEDRYDRDYDDGIPF